MSAVTPKVMHMHLVDTSATLAKKSEQSSTEQRVGEVSRHTLAETSTSSSSTISAKPTTAESSATPPAARRDILKPSHPKDAAISSTARLAFSVATAGSFGPAAFLEARSAIHAQSKKMKEFENAAGAYLCSPEMLNKPVEEWCREVIELFKLTPGQSATGLIIPLQLPADHYQYYCTLQEEIAKLIPNERDRPTIDLRLRGSEATEGQPVFGIIGGVGPLSDAAILKSTMEQLGERGMQRVKIDLYSSPPPRKEAPGHLIKYLRSYVARLKAFCKRSKITKFCVTSNTAHLNLGRLQGWTDHKMVNLVDAAAESIRRDRVDKKHVFVLGTIEGHRGRLYPDALAKKDIASSTLEEADALEMQAVIEKVKSGQNDAENVKKLLRLLEKGLKKAEAAGTPATHIMLGCTELPLALTFRDEAGEIPRAVQALKAKYRLVDSEHIFAHSIASEVQQGFEPVSATTRA